MTTNVWNSTATVSSTSTASAYSLQIVAAGPEAEPALRLRYRVFAEELGAQITPNDGLDTDEWDQHCEHLMVRHEPTGEIVGTYRIFPPSAARTLGRSYSSSEFDLDNLRSISDQLVEVGRSCVDPAHRNGVVIGLLWSGLARYLLLSGHRYLGGCASIYLDGGRENAATIVRRALRESRGPRERAVTPHIAWDYAQYGDVPKPAIPPLLRAYLRLGADVLGEPSYDPEFNTADLYILLDIDAVDPRILSRFAGQG